LRIFMIAAQGTALGVALRQIAERIAALPAE
jgi:hypothetical protein